MKRRKRPLRSPALAVPRGVAKVRNPVACSPLMKKGGAHGKTTRAKRRLAKVELAKADPRAED